MKNNNFSRIWYEIHITVRISSSEDLDLFQITCKQLSVKALIIHLHPTSDIATVLQEEVMTTSKYFGDQTGAYVEMERISNGLCGARLHVIRKKLESEPTHYSAPQLPGDAMPLHA
jgi:hypothetical protein